MPWSHPVCWAVRVGQSASHLLQGLAAKAPWPLLAPFTATKTSVFGPESVFDHYCNYIIYLSGMQISEVWKKERIDVFMMIKLNVLERFDKLKLLKTLLLNLPWVRHLLKDWGKNDKNIYASHLTSSPCLTLKKDKLGICGWSKKDGRDTPL